MTFKTLTIITLTSIASLLPMSALAASQSDVQTCREAITAQSNIDMSAYRLRFKNEKGFRNRTLSFKALSTKGASGFTFECHINRGVTPFVKLDQTVQFAKMK